MNQINPRKLMHSKWTAVTPVNREKHFMVTKVEFDEDGTVVSCELEAVMSKRPQSIDWRELKDVSRWRFGWR
ncbi:MAG: TIGR02450 family Trp-rich protein [Pseudomonadota bacterium]